MATRSQIIVTLLLCGYPSSLHTAFITTTVEPEAGSRDRSTPTGQMAQEPPAYINRDQPSLLEQSSNPTGAAVRCLIRRDNATITSYVSAADAERLCVNGKADLLQQGPGPARIISQSQVTVIVNGRRTIENRVRIVCSSDSPVLQVSLPNATVTIRCQAPDNYYEAPVIELTPGAVQVVKARAHDSPIPEFNDVAEEVDTEQTEELVLESARRVTVDTAALIPSMLLQGSSLDPEQINRIRGSLEGNSGAISSKAAQGITYGVAVAVSFVPVVGPALGFVTLGVFDLFFKNDANGALMQLQGELIKVVTALGQVTKQVIDIGRRQNEINANLLTFASTVNERLQIVSTIANLNRQDIQALSSTLDLFGRSRVAAYTQISAAVDQITGETAALGAQVKDLALRTSNTFNDVFKLIRFNALANDRLRTYIDHKVSERSLNAALLQLMHQQIDAYIAWNNRDPDVDQDARTEFATYGKFKMFAERGQWERISQMRPVNRGNPSADNAFRNQPIVVAMAEMMFSVAAVGGGLPRAKSFRLLLRCTAGFWLDLPPAVGTISTIIESIGSGDCNPTVSTDHETCSCWFETIEFSADQRVGGSVIDSPEATPVEADKLYSLQQFAPTSSAIIRGSLISASNVFTTMAAFESHMQTKCLQYFRTSSPDRIVQGISAAYRYTSVTQLAYLEEKYPDSVWPQLTCTTTLEGVSEFLNDDADPVDQYYQNPYMARFIQGAVLSWRLAARLEAAELIVRYIGRMPTNKAMYMSTISEFQTSQSDYSAKYGMVGSSIASSRTKTVAYAMVSSLSQAHRRFSHKETLSRVSVTSTDDSAIADAINTNNIRITSVSTTSAHGLPEAFDVMGPLAVNDWLRQWHPDAPDILYDIPQDGFGRGHTLRSRANKVNFFGMPPRRSTTDGRIIWRDDYDFSSDPPVYEPFDYGAFLGANFAGDEYIDPRDGDYGPQYYVRPVQQSNHPSVPDGCLIYNSVRTSGLTPCSVRNSHQITQETFGPDDRTHIFKFSPHVWSTVVELVLPVADIAEDLRSICPVFIDPRVGDASLTSFGVFGKVGSHKIFLRNDNTQYTNTLRVAYTQSLSANDTTNATAACNGEISVTLLPAEERFIDAGTSLCPSLTIRLYTYDGNPCEPIVGLSMSTLVEFEDTWSFPPLNLIGGDLEAIATSIVRDASRDVIQAAQIQFANFSAIIDERVNAVDAIIDRLNAISLANLPGDADALATIFSAIAAQVTNSTTEINTINARFADLRNQSEGALTNAWGLVASIQSDLDKLDPIIDGVLADLETLYNLTQIEPSALFDTSNLGSTIWSIIKWLIVGVVIFLLVCFCIDFCKGRAASGGYADRERAPLVRHY